MTMTNEILEGNKLIAEFMGWKKDGQSSYDFSDDRVFRGYLYDRSVSYNYAHECFSIFERDLPYHSSWDWLMPVVEKIESIQNNLQYFTVVIKGNKCQVLERRGNEKIRANFLHHTIKWIEGETKIDAVWQTIIQFIQWHQTIKK